MAEILPIRRKNQSINQSIKGGDGISSLHYGASCVILPDSYFPKKATLYPVYKIAPWELCCFTWFWFLPGPDPRTAAAGPGRAVRSVCRGRPGTPHGVPDQKGGQTGKFILCHETGVRCFQGIKIYHVCKYKSNTSIFFKLHDQKFVKQNIYVCFSNTILSFSISLSI